MFSFAEIIDIILMTLATGYIFMDFFKQPPSDDPVETYKQQSDFKKRFIYSIKLVAPAIILHEFGHKFVAMAFGLEATFHAAYMFLLIGVALKLVRFPFLIIVPAYVSTIGATQAQTVFIAAAGPAVNLLVFVFAIVMVRRSTSKEKILFWSATKYINGFLAVFNMIPIPGFDGHTFFASLLAVL